MTSIAFAIAGVGFTVTGPSSLVSHLETLFAAFPKATKSPHWSLRWEGVRCSYDPAAAPITIPSPDFAPSCTTVLIGYLLRRSLTAAIFLHGNAVIDRNDRVLILLGESGAGKTTLSQQFLSRVGCRLLAEDFLIIDPVMRLLHPYPRAASIRAEHQSREKEHRPVVDFCGEARSLENSLVVILQCGREQTSASSSRMSLWLSSIPAGIDSLMQSAGIESFEVNRGAPFPCVTFIAGVGGRMDALGESLLRAGALPLGTAAPDADSKHTPRVFPEEPSGHRMSMADALAAITAHQVRFGSRDESPARNILNLARAFSDASCALVTPGGTPARTVDLVEKLLRS